MALGLAGWLAVVAGDDAAVPVLALGSIGALLTAAALVWAVLLGVSLATSAGAYALLLAIDEPPLDTKAAGETEWELAVIAARRDDKRIAAALKETP